MEQLKHECGIVMIRLMKPISYYEKKYGSWEYGLNKLYLMMEKQHNRGQEGAGVSCVKLDQQAGKEYMFREKALGANAITEVFAAIGKSAMNDSDAWRGEMLMGHLRYSTTGKHGLAYVHPFLRRNNWRSKNLCICGNFNMTNVDEVFADITRMGQHPRIYSDTYILLEQMGHRLDREVERLYSEYVGETDEPVGQDGALAGETGISITKYIEENVRVENVLKSSAHLWDGGYVVCGQTGSGEMFAMRDPHGIRPCFYYKDDEILVVASERPAIQTAMNIHTEDIIELTPGQAVIVTKNGEVRKETILPQQENKACSFERIYFSRGSDRDIYRERKELGRLLVPQVLDAINGDLAHSVISYIPNTAEVAFFGLVEALDNYLNQQKAKLIEEAIKSLDSRFGPHLCVTPEGLKDQKPEELPLLGSDGLLSLLSMRIRSEKVAVKDIKLRTFITQTDERNDLAAHVYDITYGSIVPFQDNLVIIDDSIVRGTTLRESIISILNRLHPKKIVIVSSSPQVRYPDYYGIDMSHMDEFIAFRAAISLLKATGKEHIIHDVYRKSKEATRDASINYVREIYNPFSTNDISRQMVRMLKGDDIRCEVQMIFQSIEGLHSACPNHPGDWYFTGHYPTPGGVRLVNKAYVEWYEKTY
ncbi:MAG: amidophosphoribosyltransferase [Bacteroidaceae bacterium]|nr:amidophosphoribosyltransferase [Bacteroidaceae bacterium]